MSWKCKGYKCKDFRGTNPFGNSSCCRNMEYHLGRLVLIDELENCDTLIDKTDEDYVDWRKKLEKQRKYEAWLNGWKLKNLV